MSTDFFACWAAKRGNSPEEYEDAFAAEDATGRYAIADGATESSFAGLWARLLVDQFVQDSHRDPARWTERLSALQDQLHAQVSRRPLPWYAEAQLQRGSFATFLGVVLTVSADAGYAWRAVAVGDSCLFHTRDADLLAVFPLDRSEQFDNMPNLVGSRTSTDVIREKRELLTQGHALPGDRLWLMTDALAHWCLAEHEAAKNPWSEMELLPASRRPQDSFTAWIEGLRDERNLDNDDVTLLVIRM